MLRRAARALGLGSARPWFKLLHPPEPRFSQEGNGDHNTTFTGLWELCCNVLDKQEVTSQTSEIKTVLGAQAS